MNFLSRIDFQCCSMFMLEISCSYCSELAQIRNLLHDHSSDSTMSERDSLQNVEPSHMPLDLDFLLILTWFCCELYIHRTCDYDLSVSKFFLLCTFVE